MRKGIYSILFVLILAVSHAAQVKPATNVDVIPDVVYGHKDGMALTFDIFKPKTHPNGAAVIFIVSGGWISPYTPPDQALPQYQDFFFQAEDGIRDATVTGVQTCALPI